MMKQWLFRCLPLLLVIIFMWPTAATAQQLSVEQGYQNASQYLLKNVPNPSYGDEWVVITLARGEAKVPNNYFEKYYANLKKVVIAKKGVLHARKYTEYSRVIMALSATGKDATNVGGYNLVEKLGDVEKVNWQGVNGTIFGLIALDTKKYPSAARDKLLNTLVAQQLTDGGFNLTGTTGDVDVTAMAIQALAPYQANEKAAAATKKALLFLQKAKPQSSESIAQMITALTSLGINPQTDARFLGLYPLFFSYYSPNDGGFKHVKSEAKANGMATEQAGYALAAQIRLQQGKKVLYDMHDAVRFTDVGNSWAKDYIQQAAEKGLIKGQPDGSFKPNNSLKRVHAASILVRSLGLQSTVVAPFKDLGGMAQETKLEVYAAFQAGLIKNIEGKFQPKKDVARIQLGLMMLRAYNASQATPYVSKKKAVYKDSGILDTEQQVAVDFLAEFGIAQGSNGYFNPYKPASRAQAAKMFVQFVKVME